MRSCCIFNRVNSIFYVTLHLTCFACFTCFYEFVCFLPLLYFLYFLFFTAFSVCVATNGIINNNKVTVAVGSIACCTTRKYTPKAQLNSHITTL